MIPDHSRHSLKHHLQRVSARQDNEKKERNIVEYIIEDALETLAEHYIEDYLIDFTVGDGHDEESPIYEWLAQDILKTSLNQE